MIINNNGVIEEPPPDWELRDCVEVWNADGSLYCRSFGFTEEEKEKKHLNGDCIFMCGYCERDAWEFYDSLPKDENGRAIFPKL